MSPDPRTITAGDPACLYLEARTGLSRFDPRVLRLLPDEDYRGANEPLSRHPVLLALIRPASVDGVAVGRAALQRTYLTYDGRKADVAEPRKMLGKMPPGGAVQLMEAAEHLGIAEGVETALSASQQFGIPCWAALTSAQLRKWMPPPGVRKVTIFGDNDPGGGGQAAAYDLASRLEESGLIVVVEIPPQTGSDWNDVHAASGEVRE